MLVKPKMVLLNLLVPDLVTPPIEVPVKPDWVISWGEQPAR